ncbi:MAG TPA: RHS repeat-associated core domain-containing protein [Dehalococcoidia bacterium]|nr:RHS repeat-associated core domain-containing protein [Dehalococcoidia bacterium]
MVGQSGAEAARERRCPLQQGALYDERQFAGEQADPTGLTYLRARFYDATTGRFLSRDPDSAALADPGLHHPYAYAAANPASVLDPSGLRELIAGMALASDGLWHPTWDLSAEDVAQYAATAFTAVDFEWMRQDPYSFFLALYDTFAPPGATPDTNSMIDGPGWYSGWATVVNALTDGNPDITSQDEIENGLGYVYSIATEPGTVYLTARWASTSGADNPAIDVNLSRLPNGYQYRIHFPPSRSSDPIPDLALVPQPGASPAPFIPLVPIILPGRPPNILPGRCGPSFVGAFC